MTLKQIQRKYTKIKKGRWGLVGIKWEVWLIVGSQQFYMSRDIVMSRSHAYWFRKMLVKALHVVHKGK